MVKLKYIGKQEKAVISQVLVVFVYVLPLVKGRITSWIILHCKNRLTPMYWFQQNFSVVIVYLCFLFLYFVFYFKYQARHYYSRDYNSSFNNNSFDKNREAQNPSKIRIF